MDLSHLLLLAHAGLTALLLLVLGAIVLAQRTLSTVRERTRAAAPAARVPAPRQTPQTGASVLEWAVDLRGVGQRDGVART